MSPNGVAPINEGVNMSYKKESKMSEKKKKRIRKDDDLEEKGIPDRSVEPQWPINPTKRKSGANDRGHRNRP